MLVETDSVATDPKLPADTNVVLMPWNDTAAEQHIAWMIRSAAVWWSRFASLAGGPEVNNTFPAKRERHAPAKDRVSERSG